MNERIKELADQAELTIRTSTGTYMSHPEFNKKFAELIVKDIIKIVEGYCETSPEIMGLPLDILEHFDMELSDD